MLTNRAVLWLVGLTIAAVALVGCSPHSLPGPMATVQPVVTAALTPTITAVATKAPTPTPTLQPTDTAPATATEAPTPEFAIPGMEIVSHYTETINAPDTKYNIPVDIITDEKIVNSNPNVTIDKIYANIDPSFKTRYGETAKESIAHAVAYAEYQCWQKNDPDRKSQRAGVSFNTYWQMVKDAQAGKGIGVRLNSKLRLTT